MTPNPPQPIDEAELREKVTLAIPCMNLDCDLHGAIPHQVSAEEWEPEQCQYCYEVRLPAIEVVMQLLAQAVTAALKRVDAGLPEKKSLLADLAYQGPDVPKKYKLEITNYYKGYNESTEVAHQAITNELYKLEKAE
jgi:hypothetical protein